MFRGSTIWASTRAAPRVLVAALWLAAAAVAAWAQAVSATADRPATIEIAAPPPSERAVYLDIKVNSYIPPRTGEMEVQVTLRSAQNATELEVGRFAMFPAVAFVAKPGEQRGFRFEATRALEATGRSRSLVITVRFVAIESRNPPVGASLGLAGAEFVVP